MNVRTLRHAKFKNTKSSVSKAIAGIDFNSHRDITQNHRKLHYNTVERLICDMMHNTHMVALQIGDRIATWLLQLHFMVRTVMKMPCFAHPERVRHNPISIQCSTMCSDIILVTYDTFTIATPSCMTNQTAIAAKK